jgi:hypothetical protein
VVEPIEQVLNMRAKVLGIALLSGLAFTAVIARLPHLVLAQSLGDVARKEQERRKTVAQPTKVLTEKDLTAVPPVSPAPPTLIQPESDAAPAEGGAKESEKDADESDASAKNAGTDGDTADEPPAKDQAYWSGRVKALQEQIARNQTFAVALQSRINALANEYTNQADPLQQATIAADRQSAIAELDRVNKQVEDDRQALADLQEEARRAGVPSGWLR